MSPSQTFKSNAHFFKTDNPQCWKPACVCERAGGKGNDCVPKSLYWESESEMFISHLVSRVKFFDSCFFSLHSLNLVSFLMWFIGFKKIMCVCVFVYVYVPVKEHVSGLLLHSHGLKWLLRHKTDTKMRSCVVWRANAALEIKAAYVVQNGTFDFPLRCCENTYRRLVVSAALQLDRVWKEVATCARESGPESFLLVSTELKTCICTLEIR